MKFRFFLAPPATAKNQLDLLRGCSARFPLHALDIDAGRPVRLDGDVDLLRHSYPVLWIAVIELGGLDHIQDNATVSIHAAVDDVALIGSLLFDGASRIRLEELAQCRLLLRDIV